MVVLLPEFVEPNTPIFRTGDAESWFAGGQSVSSRGGKSSVYIKETCQAIILSIQNPYIYISQCIYLIIVHIKTYTEEKKNIS